MEANKCLWNEGKREETKQSLRKESRERGKGCDLRWEMFNF